MDYQCEVYESGYELIYAGEEDEPIEKYKPFVRPIDPNSTKRIFNLMEYPGAHAEFVLKYFEITDSSSCNADDCFIEFVNKFGQLTGSADAGAAFTHMLMMAVAVRAMVFLKEGKIEKLKQLFIKEDNNFKVNINKEMFHKTDFPDIKIIGQTPPRNYSEAAYHYICMVVNRNLKDSLVTEIIVNPHNTGTDMIVRPKDLLSALWLQFAYTICQNLEFKQCSDCSTLFEVKSKKRRFEKIYCSDKCRKRVSARKRREKEKAK